MKQVLFILLVFISFQGFSQIPTVKVKEIGLEVMTKDLGKMDWYKVNKSLEKLGKGWRLPTRPELEKIYKLKNKIGGFKANRYWSSAVHVGNSAWYFNFDDGNAGTNPKAFSNYVRAVRDL
jgi:hypothetical protein